MHCHRDTSVATGVAATAASLPEKGCAAPGQAYRQTVAPGGGRPKEAAKLRDNAAVPRGSRGPGQTVAGVTKLPSCAGSSAKAGSHPCRACRAPHMLSGFCCAAGGCCWSEDASPSVWLGSYEAETATCVHGST